MSVIVPGRGPAGRDLRRAYSLAGFCGPAFRLCIKLVPGGPGSNFLAGLQCKEQFQALMPYGDFCWEESAHRHVFVATGTGIAPFRAMLEEAPRQATVYFGVRSADELIYLDACRQRGATLLTALSQEQERVRVTTIFQQHHIDFDRSTQFYLCGNGAMIQDMRALLEQKGVTKDRVAYEKYYS